MKIKDVTNSITAKIFAIGFLTLILLIPAGMVNGLIKDRKYTQRDVVKEISNKWANTQKLYGPYLVVPYEVYGTDKDGQEWKNVHHIFLLPKNLNVSTEVKPQTRYRGIYKAVLYGSNISFDGDFDLSYVDELDIKKNNIIWDKAVFALGVSDLRGIEDNMNLSFAGQKYSMKAGIKKYILTPNGVNAKLSIDPASKLHKFSLNLKLRGSKSMSFLPLGEFTKVSMKSPWQSPSFNGSFLPSERNISKDGFNATWKVANLSRGYPQAFMEVQSISSIIRNSFFGVDFIITADVYQKTTRIAKYALMFIVFTFAAFFFSEIIAKNRIHPVQYLLVGFAVVLFYVLLLAFGEHFGFNVAYGVSSVLITVLITLFSNAILKNKYFTAAIFSTLSVLYGYLFIVLQQESYSLLMGAIGLFVVLSVIMYATRNIDWYEVKS